MMGGPAPALRKVGSSRDSAPHRLARLSRCSNLSLEKAKASVRAGERESVPSTPQQREVPSSLPSAHQGHVPQGSPWSPSHLVHPLPPASRNPDRHRAGGRALAMAQPQHSHGDLWGQLCQFPLPRCQAPCQGAHKHHHRGHRDATMPWSPLSITPTTALHGPQAPSL